MKRLHENDMKMLTGCLYSRFNIHVVNALFLTGSLYLCLLT